MPIFRTFVGWDGGTRTHGSRNQSPVPYRLATSQRNAGDGTRTRTKMILRILSPIRLPIPTLLRWCLQRDLNPRSLD